MAKDILTAKVAIVRFGAIEIEGLLFDDGRYGVAVQQAAALFQLSPDHGSRDVKRLLGKEFSFVKVKANREQIEQIRVRSAENAFSVLGGFCLVNCVYYY